MKNMTKFIMMSILVMFLPLAGCVQGDKNPASPSATEVLPKPAEVSPQSALPAELPELKGSLVILSHTMAKEEGTFVVRGVAKNVGVVPLQYAEIIVQFKDAAGTMVGPLRASCCGGGQPLWRDQRIVNLAPGETWDFAVWFKSTEPERISSYDIEAGVLR